MNEKLKNLKITLAFLIAVFLAITVMMVLAVVDFQVMTANLAILSWVTFALLGLVLITQTNRTKVGKKLKIFLLITGWSPIAFTSGVILHNAFYALGTITEHLKVIHFIIGIFEGTFFILSVPIAPIAFLVGLVGSLVLLFRKNKSTN